MPFTTQSILIRYSKMKKKLIEVALPLDAINDASAYDKLPGIGAHPKRIHHWWARLPLPTARAILFASLVDDPSSNPDFAKEPEEVQDRERERLFGIIRSLLQKKVRNKPEAFRIAYQEIVRSCDGKIPPIFDPFAGGGSIPLEAQRIGLEAHASDLNPVAVLINKAQLEIAPRFADKSPVHPLENSELVAKRWKGARGLAQDVRYYGRLIREEAIKQLGNLYPQVALPKEHGGGKADVITWMWVRTVASPNPAASGVHVPLVRSFALSTKKGRKAWVEPIIDRDNLSYHFEIRTGEGKPRKGTVKKTGATCLLTNTPISFAYIREEGQSGRIGTRLMAIAADAPSGRLFLAPTTNQEAAAMRAYPQNAPETDLPERALGFRVQKYGMTQHKDLFTPRQLQSLITLSELVREVRERVRLDALAAGDNEETARSYANAVVTFLAFAIDRLADYNCAISRWVASGEQQKNVFARQTLSMVWDYTEANVLIDRSICWLTAVDLVAEGLETILVGGEKVGRAEQRDAISSLDGSKNYVVSTDPPYYDNIGYADLSDFFYVWLRQTLKHIYPEELRTILVPKTQELVASPYLFNGDKEKAKVHFESGFKAAFDAVQSGHDPRFPMTVYYAFKQSDEQVEIASNGSGITLTTGWETFLNALVDTGFQVTATWPVRASQQWRMRAMGSNALASYIVLACRPRPIDASRIARREFLIQLRNDLPHALRKLQQGNVAPVDLAQASIGPGMAIFSSYSSVLEADGQSMSVRTALTLINQVLDEFLAEQEGAYDADTRWALAWYEQHGFDEGKFGVAETLSKAKNTSVQGLDRAGILTTGGGAVRLLSRDELDADWDPTSDARLTVWEAAQHLIRALEQGGESAAASLLVRIRARSAATADTARDLAYRLYALCERKQRAAEALAYNTLIVAWPQIEKLAQQQQAAIPVQGELEL